MLGDPLINKTFNQFNNTLDYTNVTYNSRIDVYKPRDSKSKILVYDKTTRTMSIGNLNSSLGDLIGTSTCYLCHNIVEYNKFNEDCKDFKIFVKHQCQEALITSTLPENTIINYLVGFDGPVIFSVDQWNNSLSAECN